MNPLLTDEAVAVLPIHKGRAELLEEIVGTPVSADAPERERDDRAPSRRPWLAPAAAAAVVAALVTGSAWWAGSIHTSPDLRPPAAASPQPGAYRAVLEADGWTLDSAYEDSHGKTGEVGYRDGGATLKIDWYPASGYDERYDNRRGITDPPSDGRPVDVLGLPSRMWAYSADDHTVLRPVENRHFLEIRGSGMDAQDFTNLLARIRLVDTDGFDASLPRNFVSKADRSSRVAAVLDGIGKYAHPLLPATVSRDSVTSEQSDPVQVGSDVANQVTCAWLAQYAEASRTGDQAGAQEAVDVMKTSRRWPVLRKLKTKSDVPEWVWAVTDEMSSGHVPQGWKPSCRGYLP